MSQSKPKMYLAGPLFSEAELAYNRKLKRSLTRYFDVYLPQEDGRLLVELIDSGMQIKAAKKTIFAYDMAALEKTEVFLIVLDGRTIDEGAAFELGVAFNSGAKCIGLQTDPRRLLPVGNNPMVECALGEIFSSRKDLLRWAGDTQGQSTAIQS